MSHCVLGSLIIIALALKELHTLKAKTSNYIVSVQHFIEGSTGNREHKCAGVLLTRRIVLTACSCVTKVNQDPTSLKSSLILMESTHVVVYVGTSMDTTVTTKTENKEVQRVEVMYIHPMCDATFAFDFSVIIVHEHFSNKGLMVVKTLHRPQTILEFIVGVLNIPRACATYSWFEGDTATPCVKREFNEKQEFDVSDVQQNILRKTEIQLGFNTNRWQSIRRTKRKDKNGANKTSLRSLNATKIKLKSISGPNETTLKKWRKRGFWKKRIDVDFVEKKYCTSLVSVCALNPHGCISGIHGLGCSEWCMRSLDCTERLCEVDTGSPVFCNKVLVGIVTGARVINCEGNNRIMAVVAGFNAAQQFVKTSMQTFKERTFLHSVAKPSFSNRQMSGFLSVVSLINIIFHRI